MTHEIFDVHVHHDRLLEAVRRGDETTVSDNLNRSGSVASASIALAWACERGHDGIAGLLLAKGARADYDDHGTSLIRAARSGSLPLVQRLLLAGVDSRSDNDKPLREACRLGFVDIAQCLIEARSDPRALNDLPFRLAAQGGHESTMVLLRQHGADPRALDDWAYRAAWIGKHEAAIDYLMTIGADDPRDARWRRVNGVSTFDPCSTLERHDALSPDLSATASPVALKPIEPVAASISAPVACAPSLRIEVTETAPVASATTPPAAPRPAMIQSDLFTGVEPTAQRPPPARTIPPATRQVTPDLFAGSIPGSKPPPPRRRP